MKKTCPAPTDPQRQSIPSLPMNPNLTTHPPIHTTAYFFAHTFPSLRSLVRQTIGISISLALMAWMIFGAGNLSTTEAGGGGQLVLTVVDRDTHQPIACRMHLKRTNPSHPDRSRPFRVKGQPYWHDHFVFNGEITLKLPRGDYSFELEHGLEYVTRSGHFRIDAFANDTKEVDMKRFVDMSKQGWWSGDLDVQRSIRHIELLMEADDLHVATVETDSNRKGAVRTKLGKGDRVVRFDGNRYYSTNNAVYTWPGTTISLFNLTKPLSLPKSKSENSSTLDTIGTARRQQGAWVDITRATWQDLPLLVAHDQLDSIRIANEQWCRDRVLRDPATARPRDKKLFPDAQGAAEWPQSVYFRLLDCGLRIPPSAGSGTGDSPNPIGYNRMYVHLDGPMDWKQWFSAFHAGRVTITNGPLLQSSVFGQLPGHVFALAGGEKTEFEIGLTLSTREPISYLEIIKNGQLFRAVRLEEYAQSGRLPLVEFDGSGWFLVRAVTDVPGNYRFAMTAPYYVESNYQRRISRKAVQFFVDWVDQRTRQMEGVEDPESRKALLAAYQKADKFWRDLLSRANAP